MKKFRLIIILFLIIGILLSRENSDINLKEKKLQEKQLSASQRILLLVELAEEYKTDNPQKSIRYLEEAIILNKEQGDLLKKCELFKLKGNIFYKANRLDEALQAYDEVNKVPDDKNLRLIKSQCLYNSAFIYRKKNDFTKAIQLLCTAAEIAESLSDRSWIADIAKALGDFYFAANDAENALKTYLKAKSYYEDLQDEKKLASTLNNMGSVYYKENNVNKALNCYIASHELKLKFGTQTDIAYSLSNIGSIYWSEGLFEKALEYHLQALEIYRKENQTDYLVEALNNLGMDYKGLGNYQAALDHYNKALSHSKNSDEKVISSVFNNAAYIYVELKEFKKAIELYLKSEELKKKIGDKTGLGNIYKNLGYSFQALDNRKKSEEYYRKALDIADSLSDLKLARDTYIGLSELAQKNGNFKSAYQYLNNYTILNDSLRKEINQKDTKRLLTEFDTERKEREIELLTKDNQIQKLMLNRNRIIRNSLGGGIVFVLLVFFLIFRIKQQQITDHKRIESEVRRINTELEKRVQEELTKREKQQQLLIQKSKLESLGKLAAGIAHEINQPLGGISMGLENLLFSLNDEKFDREYINNKIRLLNEYIARISQIISHVRIFSRDQQIGTLEQIKVNDVVLSAVSMVLTQYSKHNVDLNMDLEDKLSEIVGNKYKLEQVLLNLLTNAKDAVMEKESATNESFRKTINIRSYQESLYVCLEVEDNGNGIPEIIREKIFDPFFTTKDPEKGTGLGLSIVYGIMEEMKGFIEVDSLTGSYTIMRIRIPALNKDVQTIL